MKYFKLLCCSSLLLILASCSSSDNPPIYSVAECFDWTNSERAYELITGQPSTIEKIRTNIVCINRDTSDSLLVFSGLKDGKLWIEGYHYDQKCWTGINYLIDGKLPYNFTKVISLIDKENYQKEIRYRQGEEIIIDTLSYFYITELFISGNKSVCRYRSWYNPTQYNTYHENGHYIEYIKFFPSGITVEVERFSEMSLWTPDYIIVNRLSDHNSYYDCYSMDGQYQYSAKLYPFNYIGVSKECGISTFLPSKYNIATGNCEWNITEQQIIDKLGLSLSDNDKISVSYSSKQSESIWIYKVKVLYEDLYKGDDTYEIRVDINQGKLI